jgi:signal transduction histidine kinase
VLFHGRSPTTGLLFGLAITVAAVVSYSSYITRQISGLRSLQTDLADRSRKDSLQLLRIQNDLNSLALAMRDMLDGEGSYPLTAWSAQFQRIRADLDDALRRQEEVAVARQTPEQRRYLVSSVAQFWDAIDRMFVLASERNEDEARAQIRLSLQARQAALSTTVARLLVENNESERQTAEQVQTIYRRVQRQVYWFLTAALAAILITSAYLIRSNRRLFSALAQLSDQRREVAQKLIAARESTLSQVARELHDEFGQNLTAIGSMLTRASRHLPEAGPLRGEFREIGEVAQSTLENVRTLSQTLHPSLLEQLGLESTVEWYISTASKQLGIEVTFERSGHTRPVTSNVAIHVYRVLQESLNNVVKHSGTEHAWVRLRYGARELQLEVEDHGRGLAANGRPRGLGIVTMRERAELIGGQIAYLVPHEGGTLVRLQVPLDA